MQIGAMPASFDLPSSFEKQGMCATAFDCEMLYHFAALATMESSAVGREFVATSPGKDRHRGGGTALNCGSRKLLARRFSSKQWHTLT